MAGLVGVLRSHFQGRGTGLGLGGGGGSSGLMASGAAARGWSNASWVMVT